MRLALLPLDERPVNTRYPAMVAAIAGVDLQLPPPECLSQGRTPGDRPELLRWLYGCTETCDGAIVSLETLAYGGLIASRISEDSGAAIMGYVEALKGFGEFPITVFNVVTRISDADNAVEEPLYWEKYGRQFYQYSQLSHRQRSGEAVEPTLGKVRNGLPSQHRQDFMGRRLRNHGINLYMLQLLAEGHGHFLVLSSDDTSPYGLGSEEKAWLQTWVDRLELGPDRLLMYPGADEIGCVLLMRSLLAHRGYTPKFFIHYAIEGDQERIAPYEDCAVRITVERQIQAVGGELTADFSQADLIVAVNPPSTIGQEYDPHHPDFIREQQRRSPQVAQFCQDIGQWVAAGHRVIVCDVAYPNGSDPDLIDGLCDRVDLGQLAAYGAWNTAGNTIGTAIAQGVATMEIDDLARHRPQQKFLLHRFVEDWGYQHLVREQLRDRLEATTGIREITPDQESEAIAQITTQLNGLLPRLDPLAAGWQVVNVRLPWHRTFEVDFDLRWVGS